VIREPGKTTPIPFKTWTPDRDIKGRTPVGALTGLSVNTYYFKQIIYARLNPQEGQKRILHLPTDTDEMLRRHLQSEHEVLEKKRGSAEYKKRWIKRKGFEANHLLDCCVYAFATAYAVKVFRLPEGEKLYGAKAIEGETDIDKATSEKVNTEKQQGRKSPRKQYIPLTQGFLRR
jgi:phage terminase large subunit GpA-like protein